MIRRYTNLRLLYLLHLFLALILTVPVSRMMIKFVFYADNFCSLKNTMWPLQSPWNVLKLLLSTAARIAVFGCSRKFWCFRQRCVCVLCVVCRCLARADRWLRRVRAADRSRPRHVVVVTRTVADCDVIGRFGRPPRHSSTETSSL